MVDKLVKKKKKKKVCFNDPDDVDLDTLPAKLPAALKVLCQWASKSLKNGLSIHTTLDNEIFGFQTKVAIFRRDIHAITNLTEISAQAIVFYMR